MATLKRMNRPYFQPTLFAEASHVKTFQVLRHAVLGSSVSEAVSGRKWPESSELFGRDGSLRKMFRPFAVKGLPWSYKISARSGILRNGIAYPLPALVRLTDGIGRGSSQAMWFTPNVMDALPPRSVEALKKHYDKNRKGRTTHSTLREQVVYPPPKEMWPTPAASNFENPQPKRVEKGRNGNYILRKKAKPHMTYGARLQDAVAYEENQLKRTSGQLNPNWVEWLMGYPEGWTNLEGWTDLNS